MDSISNNIQPSDIAIIIVIEDEKSLETYKLAIESIQCYCLQYEYQFKLINFQSSYDLPILCPQEDFFFAKHCATSIFMKTNENTIKYVFSIEPNIGIINPLHRLEKLISEEDVIFTRRLQSHEIATSPFIIKNNEYGRMFLDDWANFFYKMPSSFHYSDSGGLMAIFLMKFYDKNYDNLYITCLNIFSTSITISNYKKFCVCVNSILKQVSEYDNNNDSQIYDNGKIKILSKEKSYQNFIRHISISNSKWAPQDFMLQGFEEKYGYLEMNEYGYWKNPLYNYNFRLHQCSNSTFIDQWEYVPKLISDNFTITNLLNTKINHLEEEHFMYEKDINNIIPNELISNDSFFYIRSIFQLEHPQNNIMLFLSRRQNIRLKNVAHLNEIQINSMKESINDSIGAYSGKISIKRKEKQFNKFKKTIIKGKNDKINTFAVCSPILHNFELPGKLLQFIKYWSAFGNKVKISIYFHSWTKNIDKMIKKIAKYKKNIEVIDWSNLPYTIKSNKSDPNFDMIDKGQELANMDCVLRNKNKAKYVVLSRLDQEIVHKNIPHLLDKISKENKKVQVIKFMLQDKIINKDKKLVIKKNELKFLDPDFYNLIIFLPDRISLPLKDKFETTIVNQKLAYTRIVGYQKVTFNVSKNNTISWYSLPLHHWSRNFFVKAKNSWFKY
uniref:Glycosyltransferase family 92 protein n=1 Tax=Strongyloides stercoralis TaxID=6248 RepID=A0AAF5HZJ8_STRER